MKQILSELSIATPGEGFTDITSAISQWITKNKISQGILVISVQHTSCSLTINENADPRVLADLSSYMRSLVPEEGIKPVSGNGQHVPYQHSEEGVDDMPAHIKTSLTCSSLSLSIYESKLLLGPWQAIYLWEHRYLSHSRTVCLHAIGEVPKDNHPSISSDDAALITNENATRLNKVVGLTETQP